jgi:hypothetical protein
MFKHVAVFLQQQRKELFDVMADDTHFKAFDDAGVFDGLLVNFETDDFSRGRM